MDLKERMKKSIENFIRIGGNTKTVELDQESMAIIDDLKNDGITDFKIDNIPLTREVAMKITALNEGINQIADSISALPLASVKSNTLELTGDKENNQLRMRAVLPDTSFSRDVY